MGSAGNFYAPQQGASLTGSGSCTIDVVGTSDPALGGIVFDDKQVPVNVPPGNPSYTNTLFIDIYTDKRRYRL